MISKMYRHKGKVRKTTSGWQTGCTNYWCTGGRGTFDGWTAAYWYAYQHVRINNKLAVLEDFTE